MRYNNTERLGVIETEKVFTKDIQWIYREQPIVDVGVDAIIEEVVKNNPTGRLIAAQIKTGSGNFHISKNNLTLYISNVHYNYWLGFVLPVILIAYLPDSELLLWQLISEENLKRTKNKWKIEISRNKLLGVHSKPELIEILDSRFINVVRPIPLQGDPSNLNVYSLIENINYIKDATRATIRFIKIMEEMKSFTEDYTRKFKSFVVLRLSDSDHQVTASINKYADELKIFAKRIESEIFIFAECFGVGISAYLQVSTIYYSLTNNESILKETKNSFNQILDSFASAKYGIQEMRESIDQIPSKYSKLKEARSLFISAIDLVLEEYGVAQSFIENNLENKYPKC